MYREASASSGASQKWFLRWNVMNFVVLVLAALASAFKDSIPGGPVVSAVLFAAGAVMTFWLRKSRLERRWYRARAVAESVKTLSWRYMICTAPFEKSVTEEEAARRLERVLHEIAKQERDVRPPAPVQVTPKMTAVRGWGILQRRELYMNDRVNDQFRWYTKESEKNAARGQLFMYAAVAVQVLAFVVALTLIGTPKGTADTVGVFATISAGALGWLQLKRYEDLAEAYDTAAKDLSQIAAEGPVDGSEEALSQFVINSENAISREHTLWLAKRS